MKEKHRYFVRDLLMILTGITLTLVAMISIRYWNYGDSHLQEGEEVQEFESTALYNSTKVEIKDYQSQINSLIGKLKAELDSTKRKQEEETRRYNVLLNVKKLAPEDYECKRSYRLCQSFKDRIIEIEKRLSDLGKIQNQLDLLELSFNAKTLPVISKDEQQTIMRIKAILGIYQKPDDSLIPLEEKK